jgi:hypothetical protein
MSIDDTLQATTHRPEMPELTVILAELIAMAADCGLPQPRYVTASQIAYIDLGFPPDQGGMGSVIAWAAAFGVAFRSEPHEGEDGPKTYIWADFTFRNVAVRAYTFIPREGPADPAPQHVDYPHEPGYLHDCPACQARCHCTPDNAPCVYDGPHEVPPF